MSMAIARIRSFFASRDLVDVVLLLSLIILGLGRFGPAPAGLADWVLLGTVVAGLIAQKLRHHWLYWLSLTVGVWGLIASHVFVLDNHKWLLGYWCLAILIGLRHAEPLRYLAYTARTLIGLVFMWATFWKVYGGEYLDGSFFYFSLLTRRAFSGVAERLAGVPAEVITQNHQQLGGIFALAEGTTVLNDPGTTLFPLSLVFSYWTIFIEGMIALAFLLPATIWLARRRDWLLWIFIATTYLIAPVERFAMTLAVLGFTQSDTSRVRLAYLGFFIALQFANFVPGWVW